MPSELTWTILDSIDDLPSRKTASLVCKAWNHMLFTSTKAQRGINLRIFSRNRGPAADEAMFKELFDCMIASDRNYANVEFCYVNFEIPVAWDFLMFLVTVCQSSIRRLKFESCDGLYRRDLLAVLKMTSSLEELYVLNRIGYDGSSVEDFNIPSLRKVSLDMDSYQFYKDVCVLAPNATDVAIKSRDGSYRVCLDISVIETLKSQLKKLTYEAERSFSSDNYYKLELPNLVELNLKVPGTINHHFIKEMKSLQTVKLEGRITDEVISALSTLSSLETVSLFCSELYESCSFNSISSLKNLKSLLLRGLYKYSWKNVSLPNLQKLHVETLGENFVEFIKQTPLTSLEIHDIDLSNTQLKRISRHLPKLERLELAYCENISDGGLKNLSQMRSLKELRLWCIDVSSEVFKRWQFLPLQKLLIYFNNEMEDPCLDDIAAKMPLLRQAVFYDCYRISLSAVEKLQRRLPRCEVLEVYRGDGVPRSLLHETHIYFRSADFPRGVLKQECPFSWYD